MKELMFNSHSLITPMSLSLYSICLPCLFLLCVVACNGSLESPEERFWKWFRENSDHLMKLDLQQIDSNQQYEKLYAELVEHIVAVHPDLSFEFSPPSDSSREFIITADGSRQAVPAVESLASVAPQLKGWAIIPFIPRMDFIPAIGYGGLEINPDDVRFSLEHINGKMGITFHIKGCQPDDDRYWAVAFLYATSILGERDVMLKSAFVEVDGKLSHDSRPITELASVFDAAMMKAGQ